MFLLLAVTSICITFEIHVYVHMYMHVNIHPHVHAHMYVHTYLPANKTVFIFGMDFPEVKLFQMMSLLTTAPGDPADSMVFCKHILLHSVC